MLNTNQPLNFKHSSMPSSARRANLFLCLKKCLDHIHTQRHCPHFQPQQLETYLNRNTRFGETFLDPTQHILSISFLPWRKKDGLQTTLSFSYIENTCPVRLQYLNTHSVALKILSKRLVSNPLHQLFPQLNLLNRKARFAIGSFLVDCAQCHPLSPVCRLYWML